ncbi:MAG: ABC transporter permease [Candidatus Thorarchaeota archaeon]|jgi:NitT/TauT family transport system permease protein
MRISFRLSKIRWLQILGFLVTLVIWQIISYIIPPIFFASPGATALALFQVIASGDIILYLQETFSAYLAGFALAIGFGVPFGIIVGYFRTLRLTLDPVISAAYATPRVTLIPLIVIWFGIGGLSRVIYIFLSAVFPCIINVMQGVAYTDPELMETGRAYCASGNQMITKIVIPNAIPYIAVGVRLASIRSMIGVITAEMFLQAVGLGGAILRYGHVFRTDLLLALVVVVALIATSLSLGTKKVEERVTSWRAEMR